MALANRKRRDMYTYNVQYTYYIGILPKISSSRQKVSLRHTLVSNVLAVVSRIDTIGKMFGINIWHWELFETISASTIIFGFYRFVCISRDTIRFYHHKMFWHLNFQNILLEDIRFDQIYSTM